MDPEYRAAVDTLRKALGEAWSVGGMWAVETALDEASSPGGELNSNRPNEPWPNPAFSLACAHLLARDSKHVAAFGWILGNQDGDS